MVSATMNVPSGYKLVKNTGKKKKKYKRRAATGLFGGMNLTKGRMPAQLGFLNTLIEVLMAAVMGLLMGQGTRALLSRFLPSPVPEIAGGLVAFGAGGIAGVGTYTAVTMGLGQTVEGQASGF